jgi:hypothetical protein
MTECVQRHDVAAENAETERWDDFRLIGKIVAIIIGVHAAAYLVAVLI